MTLSLRANTDLVSAAWLRLAVPGVGVATTLPKADAAMREVGFLRVLTVGGSPDVYLPVQNPVVAVECWAAPATEGSKQPPWNRANTLAQAVLAATYDRALMDVVLDLGDFAPARVRTVTALSEPRRIEDDPSNYGRYDLDLAFLWTE